MLPLPLVCVSDLLMATRLVTWNLERKRPTTPTGAAAVAQLASADPHVAVLTEARLGLLDSLGGFEVASEPPPDTRFADDERKVMMWSRSPWRDVDEVGDPDMPAGRFVAATTETPVGDLRVIGVCIPWHMCDVRTGTKERQGIDHIAIDPRLDALDAHGWANDHGGVPMSDHDAAMVELRASLAPEFVTPPH